METNMNSDNIHNDYILYPTLYDFDTQQDLDVTLPSGSFKQNKFFNQDKYKLKLITGESYWSQPCNTYNDLDAYFNDFYKQVFSDSEMCGLSIDGPACNGKSSMMFDKPYFKANQIFDVADGNAYNIYPNAALSYFTINDLIGTSFLCDRSPISNMAYSMAYYLMNKLTNKTIIYQSLHSICDEFVKLHEFQNMLCYLNAKNYRVVIILDSDYNSVYERMRYRGLANEYLSDIAKSTIEEYHTAQTAAFAYFANVLNYHCFDLDYLRSYFDVSTVDIFQKNKECFDLYYTTYKDKIFKPYENNNLEYESTIHSTNVIKSLYGNAIQLSNR